MASQLENDPGCIKYCWSVNEQKSIVNNNWCIQGGGGPPGMCSPQSPNSFIFMQFSATNLQKIG